MLVQHQSDELVSDGKITVAALRCKNVCYMCAVEKALKEVQNGNILRKQ